VEIKIDVREGKNDVTFVDLVGEIDIYNAPKMKEVLANLIDRGHYKLVINLEKLRYIDSTGLGIFVGAVKRAREHGGAFALVCTNPQINRIFRITSLDRVFSIFEDEASAAKGLA